MINDPRKKLNILFLCTGNSCRSQMAEGWARQLKDKEINAYSAGVVAHGLNEYAVKVMKEAGVDISGYRSKTVSEIMDAHIDHVITLCSHANESCPVFPKRTNIVHAGFDDPPKLAKEAKSEEEALLHYRRVRDEIKEFVRSLPGALSGN